jgi:hypothetical protein
MIKAKRVLEVGAGEVALDLVGERGFAGFERADLGVAGQGGGEVEREAAEHGEVVGRGQRRQRAVGQGFDRGVAPDHIGHRAADFVEVAVDGGLQVAGSHLGRGQRAVGLVVEPDGIARSAALGVVVTVRAVLPGATGIALLGVGGRGRESQRCGQGCGQREREQEEVDGALHRLTGGQKSGGRGN